MIAGMVNWTKYVCLLPVSLTCPTLPVPGLIYVLREITVSKQNSVKHLNTVLPFNKDEYRKFWNKTLKYYSHLCQCLYHLKQISPHNLHSQMANEDYFPVTGISKVFIKVCQEFLNIYTKLIIMKIYKNEWIALEPSQK